MNEPKRLLDDDDFGASLLRSAVALDAKRARERKLATLGAAAAVGAAAAGAKTSTNGALVGAIAKWLSLGVVAVALVTGVAALPGSPVTTERATERAAAPAPSVYEREARPEAPAIDPSAAVEPAPSPPPGADSVAPAPAARPLRRPAEALDAPGAPTLQEEVAALRTAREALAAGQPARALQALAVHDERFARPQLGLEAEALRIEALARAGRREEAGARARGFLERHPTSLYGARVRAFAEPGEPRGEPSLPADVPR